MTNIFEGKICSYYPDVINLTDKTHLKHKGRNLPILDILTDEKYTNSKLLNELRLRGHSSDYYQNNKKRLSAACFSSVQDDLTISRSDDNHLFHTGFIMIDIDIEKNPALSQPGVSEEMKEFIINDIPYIAYLGKSVSNIGLWGLIPIAYKDEHNAHFRAIIKYLDDRGIYIDKPLSDISRLRFVAYDPDAHFELNPEIFTDTLESEEKVYGDWYIRTDITIDSDDFFTTACKWVEAKHGYKFEKGSIHNYLVRLYAMLKYAHVGRELILQWIFKNLIPENQITTNCLDDFEIKNYKNDN